MKRLIVLLGSIATACGEVKGRPDAAGDAPDANVTVETCADAECSPYATCDDSTGTAVCTCDAGFSGNGVVCMDVNECSTGQPDCDVNAVCVNQVGTYQCVCRDGYVGDGMTCTAIWSLEHSEPLHLGSWHHAVGVGPRIYYSRDNNTPYNPADPDRRYFRSYDTGGRTVREEGIMSDADNDLCACGFTGTLVPSGSSIYYFGNYGHAYNTAAMSWSNATYPPANQRGESAQASIGPVVYTVGGRLPSNAPTDMLFAFNTASGGWTSRAPYPVLFDRGVAAALGGRLYVNASSGSGGTLRTFAVWDPPPIDAWSPLPDAPADYASDAVAFRGGIWILYGNEIHTFDPGSGTWGAAPITLPAGAFSAHIVVTDLGLFAVVSNEAAGTTEFWRYTQ